MRIHVHGVNTEKARILICPKCQKVKRYSQWVEYEEVVLFLQLYPNDWVAIPTLCPEHREGE
jgi:hypothetical protein